MADSPDTIELEPANAAALRILQFTDCHILGDAAGRLRDVDTRRSFETVLTAALGEHGDADLILATGDLAEDGSGAAYGYLSAKFEATGLPTLWLPGNHDHPATMRRHLTGRNISDARQILAGNWLILLLDSTVAGQVGGRLAESELEWLGAGLKRHADRHALVCLHHQALDAGSEWIDAKGLENAAELRRRLAVHDNVRGVLWGHVHQEAHRKRDGIEWMSTPSTCMQFKPSSREFALGDEAPGYRSLVLGADGGIETGVHRVAGAI